MAKLTEQCLERIKSVDIESIADDLDITVKSHKCCCPFHEDKHPSMKLYTATNTARCFVCSKTWDGIGLVKEKENLEFLDACKWIADRNNIWLEYEDCMITRRPKKPAQSAKSDKKINIPQKPKQMNTLDSSLLKTCFSTRTTFCQSLVSQGFLTDMQMQHAAQRYHLGATRDGGVVFWQIDEEQRVLEGKIMFYRDDCHRDHDKQPSSVSYRLKKQGKLAKDWEAARCLFGAHLLVASPPALSRREGAANARTESDVINNGLCREGAASARTESVVAIVESEKTAVICSELFPELPSPITHHPSPTTHPPSPNAQHPSPTSGIHPPSQGGTGRVSLTWLATGGKSNLTIDRLMPLKGRKIIVFPDTDPEGETYRSWLEITKEASKVLGHPIYISNILELHASDEQKVRKIDIADYIAHAHYSDRKLSKN